MRKIFLSFLLIVVATLSLGSQVPLSEYATRRARVIEQVQAPVVLFGYGGEPFGISGTERMFPETIFRQEENFNYLSGHREAGAALLLVPQTAAARQAGLPAEILFLPPRDPRKEHWEGGRLGPEDDGIEATTGFQDVEPFSVLRSELQRVAAVFPELYTLLPGPDDDQECSHTGRWKKWLTEAVPGMTLKDVEETVGALRQVKSPAEQALLRFSIEQSKKAHREAMQAMRPGEHEYEIAALMEYTFKRAGCERPGYSSIVGSGFNSTVLHYSSNRKKMEAGELVVIDVGAECDSYTADITRTLPVSGTFTPRQREIYEIVLGAQNAALAAVKPGMTLAREGENSLYQIAYKYINTHGTDRHGQALGRYFIHGLGHHIGLAVHDAGPHERPLEPGMIITIEPGIYIPEESLGVRIEDIVLVTKDGAELLTSDLPRTVEEVEKAMARSKKTSDSAQ